MRSRLRRGGTDGYVATVRQAAKSGGLLSFGCTRGSGVSVGSVESARRFKRVLYGRLARAVMIGSDRQCSVDDDLFAQSRRQNLKGT